MSQYKKANLNFLKTFLLNILQTGASKEQSEIFNRNLTLTNLISILLFLVTLILALVHLAYNIYSVLVMTAGILYLIPILLNKFGRTLTSRWLTCSLTPLSIVALSILNKKLFPETIQLFHYIDVRFLLIGSMVIPLLTVQMKEKVLMASTVSISALLLLFVDPLFNLMGVGYFDLVHSNRPYYFTVNFYSITTYLFMLFSLLFEKRLSTKVQESNEVLISFLNKANRDLEVQKREAGERNNEIVAQAEELIANQEQLLKAKAIIEKQSEKLLMIQSGLRTELVERNKDLKLANEELMISNQELQQFSYSISHNLRGPLARLLGLTNLMEIDLKPLTGNQLDLVKLVSQAAKELDEVIRDLGKIIDMRNNVSRIREKIYFQEEWSMVMRSLSTFIQPEMIIETDFREAATLYTVRPILTSIFYNLASNAIKYRSPQRALKLKIKTKINEDKSVLLEVSDNGLGMNLDQFGRSMFGLYKRFHTHTDGKGLGLYLVKLQIESLGGTIQVTSELNAGTTFFVRFKPVEVEGQIVFKSEFGEVFYNARTNCLGIIWKKQVTSEEYRLIFSKSIEMVRLYHTPFWLSDLTKQGTIPVDDQIWMVNTILPEAIRQGLRKIANIYHASQRNEEYRNRVKEVVVKRGAEIQFFTDRKVAEAWIDDTIRPAQPI